jgi:hypothetical protein
MGNHQQSGRSKAVYVSFLVASLLSKETTPKTVLGLDQENAQSGLT